MIAATALLLVLACPFWLPFLPTEGFWLARGLAVAGGLAALSTVVGRGKDPQGRLPIVLASPAFTLPLLALTFYSLVPAAYVQLRLGGPTAVPEGARPEDLTRLFAQYVPYATASLAESWVLAFAGAGLLLGMILDRLIPFRPSPEEPASPAWGMALICGAGLAFHVGKRLSPDLALPWVASLVDALPPLMMFGLALLFQGCAAQPRRHGVWLLAGLAAGLFLLIPYQVKTLVLLVITLLLLVVLRSRGWIRLTLVGAILASPLAGAAAVMLVRGTLFHLDGNTWTYMAGKIVLRQSETVFCLEFARREAASGRDEWRSGPLYFAAGLVPSILWPEKPSLSQGHAFRKFCGVDVAGHSSSVTLLGEPALRGGPWGMAAMGLVLAGMSGLLVTAWKRGGGLTTAVALGLTPWLIDFDQHFAMYAANAAKALIAVLPAALLVRYGLRRTKP